MFNQGGLSLEQAPPISVVLRFFITASVFGIVAGVLLLIFGKEVFDVSTKEALIITHILALGVMASFMLGALFQMLPVIAGVVLKTPTKKASFVHSTFTTGVIMIGFAFYTAKPILYLISGVLLGVSLLYTTATTEAYWDISSCCTTGTTLTVLVFVALFPALSVAV